MFHPFRIASASAPASVRTDLSPFVAFGVGHEVEPLPDVRGAHPRSAQISRPDGVAFPLQVSRNKVEPLHSVRARNLLSKDDWRAALADEPEPLGPKVARVIEATAEAGARERLARTGAGPDGSVVGPPGEAQGVGPRAESGEGVELGSAHNVICVEVTDGTDIDTPGGDVPGVGEVAKPRRRERLDLVVDDHGGTPSHAAPFGSGLMVLLRPHQEAGGGATPTGPGRSRQP